MSENPLLHLDFDTPIPFADVRAEHVVPALETRLDEARARLRALESVCDGGRVPAREELTFESSILALEHVTAHLELTMGVVEHLEGVRTTPELRAAIEAVQPAVSAFFTSIALSASVWALVKAYAATDEAKSLQGERARLLEKTLGDFRRSGADLGPEAKARMSEIEIELAQRALKYGQNTLDATNAFELIVTDEKALAGLPAALVEAARESAKARGKEGYRLTLQAPSYMPAMTYVDDAAVREKLYRAFGSRASSGATDNREHVRKILELRQEKAKLLGYSSYADLVCEDRMAKDASQARAFVKRLRESTKPHFDREKRELEAFRRELEGPGAGPIQPWDVAYYSEKLRRSRYDLDEEALRPYFDFERVLGGAFAVAEKLYGVQIEPWREAPVWHPSVRAYTLREPDGRASAHFYADFFPRDDKRDGAWMHGLLAALPGRERERHIAVIVGNFTPETEGKPALLRHSEVETLFHEFGHLVHHISSRTDLRSLAGTNVARDFVELPSQVMENWTWERDTLDLFARHVETGERLPDELFDRMRAARSFRAATAMMRQLGLAEFDLALHTEWASETGDPVELAREILSEHSAAPLPEDHAMACSFSHLFAGGYAAGYYSYKWAEVLDADAFSRFRDEGLFNRDTGMAFREHVLARGNAEDPALLFERFMGRAPRVEALLERHGLVASAP